MLQSYLWEQSRPFDCVFMVLCTDINFLQWLCLAREVISMERSNFNGDHLDIFMTTESGCMLLGLRAYQ
jgi:hypothetical protein